jgi:hypothetical protein
MKCIYLIERGKKGKGGGNGRNCKARKWRVEKRGEEDE